MGLAVVRDLRELRSPADPEELAAFETDVLAGFVLARASAGLADGTIRSDVGHLEQVRTWLGRPLWEMEPADADAYFGRVLRGGAKGTRLARAQALTTFFAFLELRHQVEPGLTAVHPPLISTWQPRSCTQFLATNKGDRHVKLKPTLLAVTAAGALAVAALGAGTAFASTPTPSPPASSSANPTADQPEAGDTPDTPGAADQTDNGSPEAAEPGGEQPDGADGPGGHADPPDTVDHPGGPQEK